MKGKLGHSQITKGLREFATILNEKIPGSIYAIRGLSTGIVLTPHFCISILVSNMKITPAM